MRKPTSRCGQNNIQIYIAKRFRNSS